MKNILKKIKKKTKFYVDICNGSPVLPPTHPLSKLFCTFQVFNGGLSIVFTTSKNKKLMKAQKDKKEDDADLSCVAK